MWIFDLQLMSLSSSTVGGRTKYKIVLLGDSQVGKTSIIDRFINNRFQQSYNATIGIDFLVKNLIHKNKSYRLQLWDTAGQERFKSLIPSYLKDSHLCLLVYDVASLKSLENLLKWMELYNEHKEYSAFCVIVGNKKDLTNRKCTPQVIEQTLSTTKDVPRYEISAKEGQGVDQLFCSLIDLITHRLNNIKIIDQIEEKPQQFQKQDKSHCADTAKPVFKIQSTMSNFNIQQIASSNPKNKRKCC